MNRVEQLKTIQNNALELFIKKNTSFKLGSVFLLIYTFFYLLNSAKYLKKYGMVSIPL